MERKRFADVASLILKGELPNNVDEAIAATISDMGSDWRLLEGLFTISGTVGLIAQAREELTREKRCAFPG